MPRSDTWPGGTGLESMTGMDSAGSCDSVVSVNSGFSDDSLEYLSAEEKACLMFLEETIESLDTEEDSGLSNDEPDQLPVPGNLATKMAHLSASMSHSKFNSSPKHSSKEPLKESFREHKAIQNYLVPTPLVVANSSPCPMPGAKPGFPPNKNPKPQSTISSSKPVSPHGQQHGAPKVPSEVNVVVIPPPTKAKDCSLWKAEGPSPRGPLSYEALVHLRRSASTKKSPLCPTIDHTIDVVQHPPNTMTGTHQNHGNLSRSPSEVSRPKTSPPAVAPKPKVIPAHLSAKTQNKIASPTPDFSPSGRCVADPQQVRLEALQKLGLLKDKEPENEEIAPLPPPTSHSSWDLSTHRFVRDPLHANPSRSPSFSYSQVPTEAKARPVQSSASFHHYSRREQQQQQSVSHSHPSQPNGIKAVTLERSGVGPESHKPCQPSSQPCSATLGTYRNGGYCPESVHTTEPEPVKTTTAAQPGHPNRPSNPLGYTVITVPRMGEDRKEALRKLGLLKD
ncbi:specifically androgen-regulated gene protein [Myripristis murdjan]|uniref:specifically androgen-regulated gene protein n=1 Tax=Myripristis murdjan TaxID=586833 RepID=UPI0011763C70|nr:specifically androgen-regulated gene protein [Myripristis murdjan]